MGQKIAKSGRKKIGIPNNPLAQKAVVPGSKGGIDFEAIKRAEAALAELSNNFEDWMNSECDKIYEAWRTIKLNGLNKETHDQLFHVAHDIKGEAPTLGFPLVSLAADSLCSLLLFPEDTDQDISILPLPLIEQHIEAIRAMVRANENEDEKRMAKMLNKGLNFAVDQFKENISKQ